VPCQRPVHLLLHRKMPSFAGSMLELPIINRLENKHSQIQRIFRMRFFMLTNIKIKENSFFALLAAKKLETGKVAMVIGKTIHLHNTTKEDFLNDQRWLSHELVHIEQYKKYGLLKFLTLYLWYSVKYGYYNNPLEVEAREKEKELPD